MATKQAGALARTQAEEDPNAMNAELSAVYQKIHALLDEVDKSNVLARWSLGREIEGVMTDERKFEPGAAQKLADALNIDVQELYRYRNFSTKYTKQEITALLKRKTSNGRAITWSHLDHLTRVPTDAARVKLTDAVFDQNLNVRELAAAIQKKFGNRSNNPKGKGKVGPKTPGAALSLLTKHAQSDSDTFAVVGNHMASVIGAPAKFASDDFLGDLVEAKTQLTVIADSATELLESLANAEAAVSRSLRMAKNQALEDRQSEKATTRAAANKTLSKGPAKAAAKPAAAKPAAAKPAAAKKPLVLPAAKKPLVLPKAKKKVA
jgi:hypothetical protein